MTEVKDKLARRYGDFLGLLRPFSDLLEDFYMDDFFIRPFELDFPEFRYPLMDLKDDENQYTLETEIPGLEKENINIEVKKDRIVEIKGEKVEHTEEGEEGKYIHKERGKVSFYRQIVLPSEIDPENIDAKIENGILKVTMPKKAPEPVKKVEVN